MSKENINNHAALIWAVANILRGPFKPFQYGRIILPFAILRRLDCLLEETKKAVVETAKDLPAETDDEARFMILSEIAQAGGQVYNTNQFTFATLRDQDPSELRRNLISYISGFNASVRDIFFEKFKITDILKGLEDEKCLWSVFDQFCQIDLHPETVSNLEMGYLFEELIRRFSEISNEDAGAHFTPREVVRLLVELLLANDHDALTGRGVIRRVYDPACGTGGILSIAEEAMTSLNPSLNVDLFGQEFNGESFAICKSDMLVKGHDASRIAFGNTLTADAHRGETFHYMMSNPPYGVDWKNYAAPIKTEHESEGFEGRFGAGLPRISDGQLLFVQHMVSKMRDDERGSRIGIVMNGSPLFTGGAGSGESEIRRWLIEHDLIEAIVALPTDLFYNTGIQTYIWLLSNRKAPDRRGRVQLIDASGEKFWRSMRKSLGSKRREISDEARAEIVRIYHEGLNGAAGYGDISKIFESSEFGYREIRVERPLRLKFEVTSERLEQIQSHNRFGDLGDRGAELLEAIEQKVGNHVWMDRKDFLPVLGKALNPFGRLVPAPLKKAIIDILGETDEEAEICLDAKGRQEPDPKLRDHELVPLKDDWQEYMSREVEPFVPDAWVDLNYTDARDGELGRVGYEINFNRYFYRYVPPRPLAEIEAEMKALEAEIAGLLNEVVA